jgi:WhiB family redox-sensing transcriptional regulator
MSEWQHRAACAGDNPEKWFSLTTTFNPDYEDAVEICSWCPVRIECLKTALTDKIEFGIWGGLTPEQRKRLDKRLSRNRRPIDQVDLTPHVQAVS